MSLAFRLTVAQSDHVNIKRTHALQKEAQAECAAGNFVGERLGLFVDADGQQCFGQALVGHVLEGKLGAQ